MTAIQWQQADKGVYVASARGLLLTVTHLSDGMFGAMVEGPGVTERPLRPLSTRLSAQAWAVNRAGGAE